MKNHEKALPEPDGAPKGPENVSAEVKVCGIVMPISAIDECTEAHWSEVLEILSDAIRKAGFEPNIVSMSGDSGLIHKRIVQNLYDNPIVVCDVSAKNPNVMFELGMRLAFDKPTVIVKDNKTSYSFDTGGIEHLQYPRDLRFSQIVDFKGKLTDKIIQTHQKSSDPAYTTFLKHFGEFTVAKLDKKEVSGQEYIIEELKGLRRAIQTLEFSGLHSRSKVSPNRFRMDVCLDKLTAENCKVIAQAVAGMPHVEDVTLTRKGDHRHVLATLAEANDEAISETLTPILSVLHSQLGPKQRVSITGECRRESANS